MKYKKLLIILSSVVGAFVLFLILSFTLFRVTRVEINFKNATTLFETTDKQQVILNSGKISYSTPIYAVNKTKIINNMEKSNPYLKVVNIETVFPNKLVVHCAQREELFCIKVSENLHYMCDAELKVLSQPLSAVPNENYESTQTNSVLLGGKVDVLNKDAKVGEFLKLENGENIIKNIANAFAYNNKTIADVKGMFKQINLTYDTNYYTRQKEAILTLTTFDGFETKIWIANHNLVEKLNLAIAMIPQSYEFYGTHRLSIDIDPNNSSNSLFRYEELE